MRYKDVEWDNGEVIPLNLDVCHEFPARRNPRDDSRVLCLYQTPDHKWVLDYGNPRAVQLPEVKAVGLLLSWGWNPPANANETFRRLLLADPADTSPLPNDPSRSAENDTRPHVGMPGPVRLLGGPFDPVNVLGKEIPCLGSDLFPVFEVLIDLRGEPIDADQLAKRSQRPCAPRMMRDKHRNDKDLRPVILLPGRGSRIGYRIWYPEDWDHSSAEASDGDTKLRRTPSFSVG